MRRRQAREESEAQLLTASIAVGSLILAFTQTALAQADYYKGKTVTLVVGSRVTGSLSIGIPTSASAMMGVPPIAYTSENAFAAAMRPKSYASSTIGVKKSTVATIARSGVNW